MAKNKNSTLLVLVAFICACTFGQGNLRDSVTKVALSQLGVYELTGKNDGPQVEAYLKSVKLPKGNPWCAAYVSWCYQQHCVKNPKSGWSPAWFPAGHVIYQRGTDKQVPPLSVDVFGIYFPEKKRIAHVGFILEWHNDFAITIEGNTNEAGSREGDGVYKKKRIKRQIYSVSRWIE